MTGWNIVYGDLLTFLPTLDGLTDSTFDGPANVEVTPGNFAVVGDDNTGNAGTWTQTEGDLDVLIEESGEVLLLLVAQTGDTDLAPLRAQVKTWTDALTAHYRANKTISGALKGGSVSVARVEPSQRRNTKGAVVEAVVAVGYFTRL